MSPEFPFDVIFYVLEGSGELETEEEKRQIRKDSTIEVPANLMRGWKNNGEGNLRILVIKVLNKLEENRYGKPSTEPEYGHVSRFL